MKNIVLVGGRCSGKTHALKHLSENLEGERIIVVSSTKLTHTNKVLKIEEDLLIQEKFDYQRGQRKGKFSKYHRDNRFHE